MTALEKKLLVMLSKLHNEVNAYLEGGEEYAETLNKVLRETSKFLNPRNSPRLVYWAGFQLLPGQPVSSIRTEVSKPGYKIYSVKKCKGNRVFVTYVRQDC